MSKKKRPKTTQVHEGQILAEEPVSEADPGQPEEAAGAVAPSAPRHRRPPVRERARTTLFERDPGQVEPSPEASVAPAGPPRIAAAPTHRQWVALCPFALFQVDSVGNLLWVNEHFADFVREAPASLPGRPVGDTRLGVVHPRLVSELQIAAAQEAPPTLKHVVQFEQNDGRTVQWLLWLAPETNPSGEVLRFFGYLHPLQPGPE